jgi:pimeloyl-ACP methyl ester carboxylesterase
MFAVGGGEVTPRGSGHHARLPQGHMRARSSRWHAAHQATFLPTAPSKLRDAVLLELSRPVRFLQGTRDPLCPLDLLATVRKKMQAPRPWDKTGV